MLSLETWSRSRDVSRPKFVGLGLGLGLVSQGLGLGLGLVGADLGLGLGLVGSGLGLARSGLVVETETEFKVLKILSWHCYLQMYCKLTVVGDCLLAIVRRPIVLVFSIGARLG